MSSFDTSKALAQSFSIYLMEEGNFRKCRKLLKTFWIINRVTEYYLTIEVFLEFNAIRNSNDCFKESCSRNCVYLISFADIEWKYITYE